MDSKCTLTSLSDMQRPKRPFFFTNLIEEEKKAVRTTYETLKKEILPFGTLVFTIAIETDPVIAEHFTFHWNSDRFTKHIGNFVAELTCFIDSLASEDELKRSLDKHATRHARRDITLEDYNLMKASIMQALKEALESGFTQEVKKAWGKTLDVMFAAIWQKIVEIRRAEEEDSDHNATRNSS